MKTRFALVLCVGCLAFSYGAKASMQALTPRWGHTVTALADARLLVAGGEDESGLVAAIEIFAPADLTSQSVGVLSSPRRRHAAVRLNGGRVLLVGGEGSSGILGNAELIDPTTGPLSQISLGAPRADHTATLLPNGSVLLAGGHDGTNSLASLQIFDPATNAVTDSADLAEPRQRHTATLLDDGRVLLIGGRNESGPLDTTEYWDPATGTVTAGPVLSDARFAHTATRIAHGRVVVVGGSDGNDLLATVEVFSSEVSSFVPAGSLAVPRADHTAVVLPNNGHVMVLGGRSADGPVAAVELMHPYDQTFMSLPPLNQPRSEFGAAVVGPYVWAVGGRSSSADGALGSIDAVPFATLTSDPASYPPNSTVAIQGAFWLPGEVVTITIVQSDDDPATVVTSVADTGGRFVNTNFSTGNDGSGFFVATASGEESGRTAALEFGGFIPASLDGLSLSPSAITQTTAPVTLSIVGAFEVGVVAEGTYCRFSCIVSVHWAIHAGGHEVRVLGTRNDTNIDMWLVPTTVSANRIDVTLPASVTSNSDQYLVAVRERRVRIETTTWIGFIPGSRQTDSWESVSGFFGPLTVRPPDSTPPVIAPLISGPLGANGWYTGDVSVGWSVSDPESTIFSDGCLTEDVNTDTTGTSFTCGATSEGGTSSETVTIKRDASPPVATLSVVNGTLGANGWYVGNVTVRTTGTESVSAPVTCTADQVQSADTTGQQFSGSCTNAAGLTNAAAPIQIKLDKTAPTISAAATLAPNAAGWYQGGVTVGFTCTDAASGIATCPANQTLNLEGASVASTAQVATDAAGNTSAPSNVVTVKIDKTSPLVALSGGPAHGGSYDFGNVPAAPTCSASDGLSGLGTCIISGYDTTVGPHTVVATATDRAGNVSIASATYTVLAWTFVGFYHPVDIGVVNTVKNGSTVPIRFEAFAGQTELVDPAAVNQPLMASQAVCESAETDDIELLATGGTSLRYDATAGQFVYNWQTPKKAGYCYVVTVTLRDGSSRSAQFKLK